jgi:protein tyrosine phosphatase (PTP) superfamily phosphohydrolase (DUF442 family)
MKRIHVCVLAVLFPVVCWGIYQGLLSYKNDVRLEPAPVKPVTAPLAPVVTDKTVSPVALEPETAPQRVWAEKIANPWIGNFYKLDNNLYRGAQPSGAGMRELQRLGIRTVINLRSLHSDRDEAAGTNIRMEHIRMTALDLDEEDVVKFLKIVSKKTDGPFFVHCQHGSDRTGSMCAMYRIIAQGWSREEALKEMTEGGFGFHEIWRKTLIPDLVKLDLDSIRKQVR